MSKTRTVSAIRLVFMLPIIACGEEGVWTGTVTDSAGVAIVANPEEGVWTAGVEWTFEEDMRFGALEADPEYQFGQVGFVAVGSAGQIYVSDIQAQHVKVFSSNGQYERTIGGAGNGPGEIGRTAGHLGLSLGDTLIVPDLTNRRINRYAPDGAVLPSTPLRPEAGRPVRYKATSTGGFFAQVRLQPPDTLDHIVAIEPSGLFGDTLITFPSGGASRVAGETHQFSPEPMWAVTDSLTVLYGVNNEYRIGLYDSNGALTRILTRPFEPAPVTDRDIRAYFVYLDQAWLDAGVLPSRLPELHSRVHFAEFYPAYFAIHIGYRGTIWIQMIQTPGGLTDEELERYNFLEEFGSPRFEVFDVTGLFLGVVEMPSRFQPRLFRGNMVYGVWRDDLDVQYIVRLRIVER